MLNQSVTDPSCRESSASPETVYPLGCPLGKAHDLPAACVQWQDGGDNIYWFIAGDNTVLAETLLTDENGDPGQGDRRNLCAENKKCLCLGSFFTLNSPYNAQEVLEKHQKWACLSGWFSKLSQLGGCIVTVRRVIYGCFHAFEYHKKVFGPLFLLSQTEMWQLSAVRQRELTLSVHSCSWHFWAGSDIAESRLLKYFCQLPFQAVLSEIQRVTIFSALPQDVTGMEQRIKYIGQFSSMIRKTRPLNLLIITDMNHFETNLSEVWRGAPWLICAVPEISQLDQSQPFTPEGSGPPSKVGKKVTGAGFSHPRS